MDPISSREGRDVRPHGPRLWGGCESLPQIGRQPRFRFFFLCRWRDLQRDDVARVYTRSFAHLSIHFEPVASLAVRFKRGSKGPPLMVPSTVAMPRDGSFALALFGRIRKVQEPAFPVATGRSSLALKRIMYFSWRGAIHFRQGIMTDQPTPALFKRRCLAYARFMDTVSSQDSVAAPGESRAPDVSRWIVTGAVASLVAGVLLAHVIEPGVGVEKVILAGNTPTIHIFPKTSEPHPVALLAHGVTASKETMFRFGEALAAAGFDCYAVDLAGHGESRLRCSGGEMVAQMRDITRALGRVDVFVGHSMGAAVGQASVQNGDLSPKLFIAAGAIPSLGKREPPLLLLAGNLEELVSLAGLKARSDARLVLSPWFDHVLEIFDPRLVNAGVEAACAAVGKTPPPAPRFWLWRLAGVVCGMAGALGLIWSLPELDPRLARARGVLVRPRSSWRSCSRRVGGLARAAPSSHAFADLDRSPRLAGARRPRQARSATMEFGRHRGSAHASLHYCPSHPGCWIRGLEDSFPPSGPYWNGVHLVRRRRVGCRQNGIARLAVRW